MIEKMLTVYVSNQPVSIHWHDLLELDFVLRGQMDITVGNTVITAKEGDLVLLNRDDVHSIDNLSPNVLYAQLQVNLDNFNTYIPDIGKVIFENTADDNDTRILNIKSQIRSRMGTIIRIMEEEEDNIDMEEDIIYYCLDILNCLKNGYVPMKGVEDQDVSETQKDRLWKVIDYMYDHHNRKLSIQEVAQQVYISADYLSKMLKKIHGLSYVELLSQIRSEMSIRLLLNSELSITAISAECGFSAPKYYNAAFVKEFGCTPAEYRKANKGNFLMERRKGTASVNYDHGVNRDFAINLLKMYEIEFMEHNTEEKEIVVDLNMLKDESRYQYELRYPTGGKTDISNFAYQKSIADVGIPFVRPYNNVFLWEEKGAAHILLLNPQSAGFSDYVIEITGLDESATYLYCRQWTPDYPESLKAMIRQGKLHMLDWQIVENLTALSVEYGEVICKNKIVMDIDLEGNDLASLVIQKID